MANQPTIRGSRPHTGSGRRNRRYGAGRVCAVEGCDTRLSQYNGRDKCWVHADIKIPRLRGRVAPGPAH